MGNKQNAKRSKRSLKRLRKKIWQDRQKRKPDERKNRLRNSPPRQLAESNREVPRDPLSGELDIKVEEPEVTSHVEGDYPHVLLDHSYSRAPVKDEFEWFSEYQSSSHTATTSFEDTQDRDPIPLLQTTNYNTIIDEPSPVTNSDQNVLPDDPGTSKSTIPSVAVKTEAASEEEDNLDLENVLQQNAVEETPEKFSFQKEHNYTRPYPVDFPPENPFAARFEEDTQQRETVFENRNQRGQIRGGGRSGPLPQATSTKSEDNSRVIRRRRGRQKIGDSPRRSLRLIRPKTYFENPEQDDNVFVLKFSNPSDMDILTKASMEQNELCPDLSAIEDAYICSNEMLNDTEIRAKIISPSTLPDPEILKAVPSIPSIMISKKNMLTSGASESEPPKHLVAVPFVSNEEPVKIQGERLEEIYQTSTIEEPQEIQEKPMRKLETKRAAAPKRLTKTNKKQEGTTKKPAFGTLRVKTQDELNALAGSSVPKGSKVYLMVNKRTVLPVNRSLVPVPQRWRQKFEDSQKSTAEQIPKTPPATDDPKLSKDITGKRIKNARRITLENPSENLPDGMSEKSSQRRSSRVSITQSESQVGMSKETSSIDVEAYLSQFVVIPPIDVFIDPNGARKPGSKPITHQVSNPRIKQKRTRKRQQETIDPLEVVATEMPIIDQVDNIIKDVLAEPDDNMEEVDVLRVDLKNVGSIVLPTDKEGPKTTHVKTLSKASKNLKPPNTQAFTQRGADLCKIDQPQVEVTPRKKTVRLMVLHKTFNLPVPPKPGQKLRANIPVSPQQCLKKLQKTQTAISDTGVVNTNYQVLDVLKDVDAKNGQEADVKESGVKTPGRGAKSICEIKKSDKVKELDVNINPDQLIDEKNCNGNKNSDDSNKVEDLEDVETSNIRSETEPSHLSCHKKHIIEEVSPKPNQNDRRSEVEDQPENELGSSQCQAEILSKSGTTSNARTTDKVDNALRLLGDEAEEFSFPQIRMQDLEDVFGSNAENQTSTDDVGSPNPGGATNLMKTQNNGTEKYGGNEFSDESNKNNVAKRKKQVLEHRQDLIQKRSDKIEDSSKEVGKSRSVLEKNRPVVIAVEKTNSAKVLDEEIDSDSNDDGANDDSDSSFTANIRLTDSSRGRNLRRSARIKQQISNPKQPVSDEIVVEYPAQEQEDEQETVFTEVTEIHNAELFANKRFCHYCQKPCLNFYVHLQEFHYKEWEVRKFLKAAKDSPSRRTTLKKWYLLECYANAFEHKDHLSCANCLNIVHKSTAFFHYIRCAARRKKRDPVVIPEDDIFENLSRLTVALKAEFSTKSWMDLAKCLLVSLYVLNDRVPSVESLLISDYNKARMYNTKTDMELAEIVEETHKVKYFMTNDISLKVATQRNFIGMPIFLTAMQDGAISLLLKYRIEAEVPLDNDFVFGCATQELNEIRIPLADAIKDYVRDIHQKEISANAILGSKPSISSIEGNTHRGSKKDKEQFDFTPFDPLLWEPLVRLTRTDLAERLLSRDDECSIEIKNELPETIENETSSTCNPSAEGLEKLLGNVASDEPDPTALVKVEDETSTIHDQIAGVSKDFPTTSNISEIPTFTSATASEATSNKSEEKIIVRLPSSRLLSKRKKSDKKNKRRKRKIQVSLETTSSEENDDHSDPSKQIGESISSGTSRKGVNKSFMNPSVPIVPLDISSTPKRSRHFSKTSTKDDDQNINPGLPITKAILYPPPSSSKKKYTIKNIKILPLKPRSPQTFSDIDDSAINLHSSSNSSENEGQKIIGRNKSSTSKFKRAADIIASRPDEILESDLGRKKPIPSFKSTEGDVASRLDKSDALQSNFTPPERKKSTISSLKNAEDYVVSRLDKFEAMESNFSSQNIIGRRKSTSFKSMEDDVASELDRLEETQSTFPHQNITERRKSTISSFKNAEDDIDSKLDKLKAPEPNFPTQNIIEGRKSVRAKSVEDHIASDSSSCDDRSIEYPAAAKRKKLNETQKLLAGPSTSKSCKDGDASPGRRCYNLDKTLLVGGAKMRKEKIPKGSEVKPKFEEAGSMVNDVFKCFYLKTGKISTKKCSKRMLDIRDLISCANCKKFFLRACFLKHRRWCIRHGTIRGTEVPKPFGKDRKYEEAQSKHRSLKTLQSPGGAKKYFCIFCKQTFTKLTRHLEHVHKEEEEVKEMLKHPKRSPERKRILYRLRTKGTFAFNVNAEYNGGKIIVSRRPNPILQRTSRDFLPCPHCKNYFAKKTLYRHTRRCSNKEGRQKGLRRSALALINSSHPRCNKIMAAQIISRLVDDQVSEIIKKDELLILFGNHLTRKHPSSKCKGYYIRQNLRIASKFFLALKTQNPSVSEFSSIYHPDYCEAVLEAVKTVAGYDVEKRQFKLPEIARKLDRIIKISGEVLSMECSKKQRLEDRRRVAEFMREFSQRCKKEIIPNLSRPKQKSNEDSSKDMFQFCKRGMLERTEVLKRDFSFETWIELANFLLVHLRLLNNNIQDGASLFFSDYLQRHSLDSDEDSTRYHTLGALDQFPKNYLKVRLRNAHISLLLSQEFCGAVDVLLENREDAGVPVDNPYLFGKPEEKEQHYTTKEAEDLVKVSMNESKLIASETKVETSDSDLKKTGDDPDVSIYLRNIKRAFDYHTSRMLELTDQVRLSFSNQFWIELNKCALTCIQLTNDKTYTEVIQYMLLLDYGDKELVDPSESLSEYNSLVNTSWQYFKLTMRGTPITLLLSYEVCQALDVLILERGRANIDQENPYVFACSGNKYNYYRSEGCIGSLPVSDGVTEILTLRLKIIKDLIKNGSVGIQLWKLLPETNDDLTENAIRVFYYAQSKMVELKYKLEEKFSGEIWLELIRCALAYIHLLNDRCPENPEMLLIFDYLKRERLSVTDQKASYHSLDDVNDFPENYLKVRVDEGRFILLSLDFCETVDLLLRYRHECGVHGLNPYVFGCRGTKMNYLRAHGVLAQVAARCGVKRLRYFKAKRIRGVVEMQEHTLDMKDVSKTEWDILLNRWKINHGIKSTPPPPVDKVEERKPTPIPRRRWTPEEMAVASSSFENCLTKGYLPSVFQCQQVISANVELQHRTPEQLKAWVNNQLQKRGLRARADGEKRSVRCRWSSAERQLVSVYFAYNLAVHTLPSAADCRKAILSHEELANRTPEQVRAWINNQNKRNVAAKRASNYNA